jgi:hypothetical protein
MIQILFRLQVSGERISPQLQKEIFILFVMLMSQMNKKAVLISSENE